MLKRIRNFLLKWFAFIAVLVGLFAWFLHSEFGNSFNFIKDNKIYAINTVSDYLDEKKEIVMTSVSNKMDSLKNGTVADTKDPSDNQVTKEKKETSEFTKMVIPFFYDHSEAPKNVSKDELLNEIKKASKTWENACNISFEYKGNRLSDYIDTSNTLNRNEGLVKWADLEGNAIGQAHQGTGKGPAKGFILVLNPEFFAKEGNNNFLYPTILHELGHVIGLDHNKNAKSIMYWEQQNRQQQLSETDKTMCKYFRARWSGSSVEEASEKYGILVNEASKHHEVEKNNEED